MKPTKTNKEKVNKLDEGKIEQAPITLDMRIANLEVQIPHQEAILNQMKGALAVCKELKSLENRK